jgi:hypothetical protein
LRARHLLLGFGLLVAISPRLWAATDFDPYFANENDFGDVGLLQTPTARMHRSGTSDSVSPPCGPTTRRT